jgi:molecular chaperone DnaJ
MQPTLANHDLYALLGVHPSASAEEIRLAYRQRAMLWHPDRNRCADAEETFKLIRSAYDVLRDPSRRSGYDRNAASRVERAPAERPAAAAQREPHIRRAPDVRRHVRITLDEQLRGARVELQITRTEYCSVCGGSGTSEVRASCDNCKGSGYMRPSLGWFPSFLAAPSACTDCGGEGVTQSKCVACVGNGTIARKRGHLRFDIPAGVPPGGSLRVPGHGRRGRSGRLSGDLLINVGLAAHPLFEADFPHLRCEMPISVFRALAGGTVEVPTLGRPVSVRLPTDVVDATELGVPSHGMLNGATGERGDLLVRLRLIRPSKLSGVERELLAKLEQLAVDEPRLADWVRRRRDADNMKRSTARQAP